MVNKLVCILNEVREPWKRRQYSR
jgi:hypothetical protein